MVLTIQALPMLLVHMAKKDDDAVVAMGAYAMLGR